MKWTVVTGSTGGIGTEIVRLLARRNDDLVLVNRTESRASVQRSALLEAHPGLKIELVTADLMDTGSIAQATTAICALPGSVIGLYNNAGVLTTEKIASAQGFESTYAVNTLAPYQLIRGLRTKMAQHSGHTPAMIVNFSSSAINRPRRLNVDELANPREVSGLMGTYAQSKLALTALTASLAEELETDNILIRAIDPGATKTAMTTKNTSMPRLLQWLAPLVFNAADKQAAKVVLAADPRRFGGRSGIFVSNLREKRLPKTARNRESWREIRSLLDRSLKA